MGNEYNLAFRITMIAGLSMLVFSISMGFIYGSDIEVDDTEVYARERFHVPTHVYYDDTDLGVTTRTLMPDHMDEASVDLGGERYDLNVWRDEIEDFWTFGFHWYFVEDTSLSMSAGIGEGDYSWHEALIDLITPWWMDDDDPDTFEDLEGKLFSFRPVLEYEGEMYQTEVYFYIEDTYTLDEAGHTYKARVDVREGRYGDLISQNTLRDTPHIRGVASLGSPPVESRMGEGFQGVIRSLALADLPGVPPVIQSVISFIFYLSLGFALFSVVMIVAPFVGN